MTERRAPFRGRPALTGWAAAALAVTGSLAVPACGGETVNQPVGKADGGVADAASEAPFMGGVCNVAVDAAFPDAAPDAPFSGGGICAVAVDADVLDAATDDAAPDATYVGGIC